MRQSKGALERADTTYVVREAPVSTRGIFRRLKQGFHPKRIPATVYNIQLSPHCLKARRKGKGNV